MAKQRLPSRPFTFAIILVSAATFLFFLCVVWMRLRYPFEVEWLEGAFMDHIMRLRDGRPLYVAPSLNYVPYLYTPLYYYVAAAFMSVFGEGLLAARLVSLFSTIISAWLIFRTVSRLAESSGVLALSGAAIFIAGYGFGGFYYDAVRMDMLMVLFLLLATLSAIELKRLYRSAMTALFLVAAYYTKQQALFAVPIILIWLALQKKREGAWAALLFTALFGLLFLYFQSESGGWFYYYTFEITKHLGKNFQWKYALTVLPFYALRYWSPLFVVVALWLFRWKDGFVQQLRSPVGLLLALTAAMFGSAVISMGNPMGYVNLSIPFVAFASILLPLAFGALVESKRVSFQVAASVLLVQIGLLGYGLVSEKLVIPQTKDRVAGETFLAQLRALPGEVYVQDHGYLPRLAGKGSHAHITSVLNLLDMTDSNSSRLQKEIDSAYAFERFGAVVLDRNTDLHLDSIGDYRFAKELFADHDLFVSRKGAWATQPDLVYLPRR